MKTLRPTCILLFALLTSCVDRVPLFGQSVESFRVMTWNIWHGGREDGEKVGPQRVVEVIRQSRADIVAMQETYGSGERISEKLGFHFHPRGTNVSIHSRFPVVEDISVFEEFKCVGALIEFPDKRRIAFYSIWLPYNAEIWEEGTRDVTDIATMKQACQASCDDLQKLWAAIKQRLDKPQYEDVPIIIAGDFNSMSHLDYIEPFKEQFDGGVIDWPTSHVLVDEGFRDSWRELHPEVNRKTDRTWTPRFPGQQQDRIDYVYYRGNGLEARESSVVDTHGEKFPSDHAAVVTEFDWNSTTPKHQLRVVSYNIKHGLGNDRRLDLDRTASVLGNMRADVIGLQEVDNLVNRSGKVDQASFLGEQLGMQSAFGSFMNYQGGKYGLAILSRHPIVESNEVRLPDGNEPRVALACKIRLPSGRHVMAVNLHLDWVRDDEFRFAQAEKLAGYLKTLEIPYVLLGDFNDVPGSRTLDLLSAGALPATKPADDRFTMSSTDPGREIDFIFAASRESWKLRWCRVLDAPITSDHRPVLAILELKE